MSTDSRDRNIKRVQYAADNMSVLINDIIKKARKSFKDSGNPEVDGKFLKDSVGTLRELYGILDEWGEGENQDSKAEGIIIRFEKETESWSE